MSVVLKEYKRKKRIKLSVKLFIIMVSLVFITIIAFSIVELSQLINFTSAIFSLGKEQNEVIGDTLSESMLDEAKESFCNYANLAAEMTDYEFSMSKHDAELVAGEVQNILSHPELYQPMDIDIPRAEDEGKLTLQLLHSEEISDENAKISAYESRLGNLEPLLNNVIINSDVTRDFAISMPDGTSIYYDNMPMSKITHDGKIKFFDGTVRPWYAGAEYSKKTFFTPLTTDYYNKQLLVMVGAPVYVDGNLAAVCGTSINLDKLSEMFDHTSINDSSYTCVISESGTVVYSGKGDGELGGVSGARKNILRSANTELAMLTEKALSGENGFEKINIDGKNCYVAYAPVKLINWTEYIIISEDDLYHDIYALTRKTSDISQKTLEKTMDSAKKVEFTFIIVAAVLLSIAAVSSVFFSKTLVKPILMLRDAGLSFINRIDYQETSVPEHFGKLNISTGDEIEDLWLTMEDMEINIAITMRKIRNYAERKAAVDAQLSLATNIQANALPKSFPAFPDRKEFDLYAFMQPALEVGGDFYDYFLIDDDHLALVIADVSDKGVPSALFMMLTQTMIETLSMAGGAGIHPKELFSTVNDRLKTKNTMAMFVTVWMGILTLSTGELSCANAGHEYPALCSGEGETSGGFRLHKVQHSPPLAAFPGVPFNAEDLSLKKGDILFVYTDGVTEATSSAGELFGEERMLSVLNQNTEKTPYEIIENMYGSLQSFIGDNEQFDDITMLALKFRG